MKFILMMTQSLDPIAIMKCANSWISLYNHPKAKKWYDQDELAEVTSWWWII